MRRNAPNAFTLIELVITMTAAMTLMMLAIGMIRRTLNVATEANARMDHAVITDQLVRQFRRDAHRATSVEVDDDIRFELADGTSLRYRGDGNAVVWEHLRGSDRVSGNRFELGIDHEVRFGADTNPKRVTLTIQRTDPVARPVRHVSAVSGRWPGETPAIEEDSP